MTDSRTLADLRIVYDYPTGPQGRHEHRERRATREDILAILQELGAMKRDAINGTGWAEDWLLEIPSPGRYLIVPIEEE